MDTFLLSLSCLLVLQVVAVDGYCDSNNLNTEVQKCLFQSPVFSGGLSNANQVQSFCRSSLNTIVDCMEAPIAECKNHPTQEKLLNLLIDMNKLRAGLQYLCDHVDVLSEKSSCMNNIVSSATSCMASAVDNLTSQMQHVKRLKDVFDLLCTFFDRLIVCYVDPFTGDCTEIGTIFRNVFNGIKYPYCDLQEFEKEVRMTEIENSMSLGSASETAGSVVMLALSLFTAMALYH
ncbi:uncharacterized protein LOC121369239 [Gigantopelta aegis]|uniref:uncharacterized protein LOC121369239 n=1 Tax=Gigantopelta aegis TaxID=1735272 RepID=UPI001B88E1B2|nr:uncharacterized protein LOC121369239 [Gigantopelta aegis]